MVVECRVRWLWYVCMAVADMYSSALSVRRIRGECPVFSFILVRI